MRVTGWRSKLPDLRFIRVLTTRALLACVFAAQASEGAPDNGLVRAEGYTIVSQQCTVCHSAGLITRSRASREGWLAMIRWMQEKQGLWPLGENESVILDYLEANYSPRSQGRRPPLPAALLPP